MPRGRRSLPRECLRRLEAADLILHAGDFTAPAVLEDLRELGPVEGIVGNVDEAELRTLLPERCVVEVAGLRVGMVHDAGPSTARAERLIAEFPDCAVVVYGHTHVPDTSRVGGTWILNPGSPTERRSSPRHTMAELEIVENDLTVRTYVL